MKLEFELSNVQIFETTWQQSELALRAIRTPVFIFEQLVTPEFEWDEIDESAVHVLATVNEEPVGCLRIIDFYKIGRMAVLKEHRKKGIGAALLFAAEAICKQHGSNMLYLSAQTHAIGFYQKSGFIVTSDIYQDLHIPHVDMKKELQKEL